MQPRYEIGIWTLVPCQSTYLHAAHFKREEGLLPPRVQTQDMQLVRVMENVRKKPSNLEKHVLLTQ